MTPARALLVVVLVLVGCNSGGLAPGGAADLGGGGGGGGDLAADLAGTLGVDLATGGGDGHVGDRCASDNECGGGECITQAPFTAGYCSARINECPAGNFPICPDGAICLNPGIPATGGLDYCVKPCSADPGCRVADGYKCCTTLGPGSFCYPAALCP
jgi:hypothetical protein